MADQSKTETRTVKAALTAADKREYVTKAYGRCPFCGDHSIEGSSFDFDANYVSQEVLCHTCGAAWQDLYGLKDITVQEAPEAPTEPAPEPKPGVTGSLTFEQLIAKINDAYPDGRLAGAAERDTERYPVGDDSLADAVVHEIRANLDETDEPEAQLRLVLDSVDSMVRDLEGLRERLHELWQPLAEGE